LIRPEQALRIVLERVRPLPAKRLPLLECAGLRLAEDVRADRDQPPADRSAMDGFAVRAADLAEGRCRLRLVGEVAAGSEARPRVRPGTCVRILTGANVPPGADTVVQVEETREEDGFVVFEGPPPGKGNIRRRGEEARKGTLLLRKGDLLTPPRIGLCAAVGKATLRVVPRARVAVLCTGEEVLGPSARVKPHQLRDSNGPSLVAALTAQGWREATSSIVPDDPARVARALQEALDAAEMAIVTGGVSVGEYDYVPEAVVRVGGRTHIHGVRMKPGKPVLYATVGRARHIFGLPGNPLSVMTSFHEFVLPALRRMGGAPKAECQPVLRVRLGQDIRAKSRRVEAVVARLRFGDEGPEAVPVPSQGSADLAAGARCDGVVIVPLRRRHLSAGEWVAFRPWRPLP